MRDLHYYGTRIRSLHVSPLARRSRLTSPVGQTQPAIVYITRLTGAAILAYLAALLLTGSERPVLAPLTALLVVQASLFQTVRSAIRRVSAVTVGVLLAVILSAYIPFSWWMLGLLTAGLAGAGHDLAAG